MKKTKNKRKHLPSLRITSKKARKILKDGMIRGKPLTAKQKRMFGAAVSKKKKRSNG